jgi:hypothetical protein
MKIFVTYNTNIVKQCQFFAGVLPLSHLYVLKCMSFWSKLEHSNNDLLHVIFNMCKNKDIKPFAQKYCCSIKNFMKDYSTIISDSFKSESFYK